MAKDPAFLFYPNDYLGGTLGMTFEEKGAYIELLMVQFNRGHMTTHMLGQIVGQIWEKIKDKFVQDENGLWYNERLEQEQNKRKAYSDSRRNNILGTNQHTKKEVYKDAHMTSHMENENIVIILNKRIEEFKTSLFPFTKKMKGEFADDMVKDFFDYWSELNKSGTKMRWELEKTWDIKKRLTRWSSNDFGKKTKIEKVDKDTLGIRRAMGQI